VADVVPTQTTIASFDLDFDDDDEEEDVDEDEHVELWRSRGAEGFVSAGLDGHALGTWKVARGSVKGRADFSKLHAHKSEELGELAAALVAWQQVRTPAALRGVDAVKWHQLETWFGEATAFPFLLRGLASGDPVAFAAACSRLWDPILHQSTISEAAGPAFRFMAAVAETVADVGSLVTLLEFLAAIATRDGNLDAANTIVKLYRRKNSSPAVFAKHDVERAYFDVSDAITKQTPLWIRLAAHGDERVRHWAVVLLALSSDPRAMPALCDRRKREKSRFVRAEILVGLALQPCDEDALVLDASDRLLAFASALTWVRRHLAPADRASEILFEAIKRDVEGFDEIYLSSGDAKTDATSTLTLLPPQHLDRLCSSLRDSSAGQHAIAIASALLGLVFDDEREADAPLDAAQREVVAAIAASDAAWRFDVNLCELLRRYELPVERNALARGKAGKRRTEGVMLAFGGPHHGVESFRS